jgi:hypothetical protein
MAHAELKALDSTDPETGYDLEDFVPANAERFGIEVTAHIGLRGGRGADLFSIIVCTPQWLSEQSFEKGFLWGAHYLFVTRWDLSVVRRAITDMCRHTEGPDWAAIATKLSRYGYWEFEDYRESI